MTVMATCACSGRCKFPPYTCDGNSLCPSPPHWLGGGIGHVYPTGTGVPQQIDYDRLADAIVKRLKERGI